MLVMLLSFAVSACAAPAVGSKPLPFQLRNNAIIVPVEIPGAGEFRFLLDTGASRSIISERLSLRLALLTGPRTLMITPVGHVVRPSAPMSLRVGDHDAVEVAATIVPDETLSRAGVAIDGILAQDVLGSLVYTIDYVRRVIEWDSPAPAGERERIPLQFDDGRALLTIPAQPGVTRPLRLIPDTGADALVFFARRGRPLPAFTPRDVGTMRTLAGFQVVRRVTLDRLQVGAVVLDESDALVMDDYDEGFPGSDGLLPLHLFSRVTFNGPEGYLTVEK